MELEEIKNYFSNKTINLTNTKIDLELLKMFFDDPQNELSEFVREIINSGTLEKSIFIEKKTETFLYIVEI